MFERLINLKWDHGCKDLVVLGVSELHDTIE